MNEGESISAWTRVAGEGLGVLLEWIKEGSRRCDFEVGMAGVRVVWEGGVKVIRR